MTKTDWFLLIAAISGAFITVLFNVAAAGGGLYLLYLAIRTLGGF